MPGGWAGSSRRSRLPRNWEALRAAKHRQNPLHVCHVCGKPGGDQLDHIVRGDDHSLSNLGWIHTNVAPYCHRAKSSAEGNAAKKRVSIKRPKEQHPGMGG
jgi:5-methylcytosine-specific restriction protein A